MSDIEFVRTEIRRLSEVSGQTFRQIADSAGVGHSWLLMFVRGRIPNPAYARIRALLDYLRANGVAQRIAA